MDMDDRQAAARHLVQLYGRMGAEHLAVSKMNAHMQGGDVENSLMWAHVLAECGRLARIDRCASAAPQAAPEG